MRTSLPTRAWCALAGGLALLGWPGGPAAGQGKDLSVEVGASRIAPPTGVEGDPAQFLVAGLRATSFDFAGSGLLASFLVGRSLDEATGANFVSGTLEGALWRSLGMGWSAGMELRGFGFDVGDPFPYRAVGVEGGPALRFSTRNLSATLAGLGGGGWSRAELRRYTNGPVTEVEDHLWRYGATAEVLAGSPSLMAGLSAGLHETVGGTYRSAGARILAGKGGAALELRVDGWKTPLGSEVTGGLAFVLPSGGWSLRGFLGRSEPDPLTLAEPGGGSGGILLGRTILGSDPLPPVRPPLHQVVEQRDGVALVEIHVTPPTGAGQVELLGDFTLWEAVAMTREGELWTARVEIPYGTHHFGFLADGAWFLPQGAPDVVPDEWGRENATLVIER